VVESWLGSSADVATFAWSCPGAGEGSSGLAGTPGFGVLETTSTSATKRYPLPETVSTKVGVLIESPRAWRIFRMAVWTPVSTSTNTSLPHNRSTMSARDTS
jgi:hypothetical protein